MQLQLESFETQIRRKPVPTEAYEYLERIITELFVSTDSDPDASFVAGRAEAYRMSASDQRKCPYPAEQIFAEEGEEVLECYAQLALTQAPDDCAKEQLSESFVFTQNMTKSDIIILSRLTVRPDLLGMGLGSLLMQEVIRQLMTVRAPAVMVVKAVPMDAVYDLSAPMNTRYDDYATWSVVDGADAFTERRAQLMRFYQKCGLEPLGEPEAGFLQLRSCK